MATAAMGTPLVLLELLSKASNLLLQQARNTVNRELLVNDAEEYRIAVILAHAACDLQTEETLEELVKIRGVKYLSASLLPTFNLNLRDKRAQGVYEALSGDTPWALDGRVRRATWWDAWSASAERRDGIAHRGMQVTLAEADASVNACQEYVNHLLRVVGEVRQKYPKTSV